MTQEEGGVDSVGAGAGASATEGTRMCAWCGTAADPNATACASCGAALAQRESIGDLAIPGLTAVDAALQDFDKRPLHLRGPSPSQGMAPAIIVGAMAGGPIGLAAIGGVAAVAAAEYLGARRDGTGGTLEDVGRPSEVALQALQHIEAGAAPDASDGTPAAAADDGRSIWNDLPTVAPGFETMEQAEQDEEGRADGH